MRSPARWSIRRGSTRTLAGGSASCSQDLADPTVPAATRQQLAVSLARTAVGRRRVHRPARRTVVGVRDAAGDDLEPVVAVRSVGAAPAGDRCGGRSTNSPTCCCCRRCGATATPARRHAWPGCSVATSRSPATGGMGGPRHGVSLGGPRGRSPSCDRLPQRGRQPLAVDRRRPAGAHRGRRSARGTAGSCSPTWRRRGARGPFGSTHLDYQFDQSATRQRPDRRGARRRARAARRPHATICRWSSAATSTPCPTATRSAWPPAAPRRRGPGCCSATAGSTSATDPGRTWRRDNPYQVDTAWPQRRLDYVFVSWPRPSRSATRSPRGWPASTPSTASSPATMPLSSWSSVTP